MTRWEFLSHGLESKRPVMSTRWDLRLVKLCIFYITKSKRIIPKYGTKIPTSKSQPGGEVTTRWGQEKEGISGARQKETLNINLVGGKTSQYHQSAVLFRVVSKNGLTDTYFGFDICNPKLFTLKNRSSIIPSLQNLYFIHLLTIFMSKKCHLRKNVENQF